jgi:hypothetical protein
MPSIDSLISVLDRSKKRIAIAFGLALALHFPLTPALPVLRLASRLTGKPLAEKTQKPPPPQEVEVELREALHSEEVRREQAHAEPPDGPSMQMAPPADVKFAGAQPKPDADKTPDKPKEVKKDKVKAVGLEGNPNSKIIGKPAVTMGLWFGSLRDNPLGKQLTELAACDREWKRFLDQGIDPLNDFEGVLVVGPGLMDSNQLTAAVRHNLSAERVHGVMQTLVEESGDNGRWLASDVASARLGRNQRVLLPQQKDLFFVTPSKGWEALHRVKEPLRVPSAEGRTASLVLVNPNRVLERVGLTLPKRISEMRLEAFANADQSVDLKVELEATSAEAAKQEASRVSAQMHDFFADAWTAASALRALSGSNAGETHLEVPPHLDLEVDDRTLTGMLHLTQGQTRATLRLLSSFVCRKKAHAAKP